MSVLRPPRPWHGLRASSDTRIAGNIQRFQQRVRWDEVERIRRPDGWAERIEMVVPCYNHGRYLPEAFEALVGQSLRVPMTVTLVDDNSSDDSLSVMGEVAAGAPDWLDVRVLHNERNLNQAGSINRAVADSDNALFVILNADDVLTSDCMEVIVRTYEQEPDIYLLGGTNIMFHDDPPFEQHVPVPVEDLVMHRFGPEDAPQFDHLNAINMSQSSCSFFRPAWEAVDGYWPRRSRVCSFDDRDFQMRVCAVLPIGIYEDYPMEFWRLSSSQQRATI